MKRNLVAALVVAAVVCATAGIGTWLFYAVMGADMTGAPHTVVAFGLIAAVTLGAIAGIVSLARRR